MAKTTKAINVFDLDNYSQGGGGYWQDGPARIESARFGTYDFGKDDGRAAVCMILALQPLDKDGGDNGDLKLQYYPIGDGIELLEPVKGEKGAFSQIGFAADSKFDKVFGLSDFAIFMSHLGTKSGFDMDAVENDITALDGTVGEFVKITKPENPNAKPAVGEDGESKKKYPKQVVCLVEIAAKKTGKKAPAKGKKEEEEEKPAAKSKAKKSKEFEDDDLEGMATQYLESEVFTDDNAGGITTLTARMDTSKYVTKTLGKSADIGREVAAYVKENLAALATAAGWSIKNSKLVKDED